MGTYMCKEVLNPLLTPSIGITVSYCDNERKKKMCGCGSVGEVIILHACRPRFNLQHSINWVHMPIIPALGRHRQKDGHRHSTDEDTRHGRASILLYIAKIIQNSTAAIGNNAADDQNDPIEPGSRLIPNQEGHTPVISALRR